MLRSLVGSEMCIRDSLVSRADDALESFKVRYENYEELTIPLYDYYTDLGPVDQIDGTQSPDKVYEQVINAVTK